MKSKTKFITYLPSWEYFISLVIDYYDSRGHRERCVLHDSTYFYPLCFRSGREYSCIDSVRCIGQLYARSLFHECRISKGMCVWCPLTLIFRFVCNTRIASLADSYNSCYTSYSYRTYCICIAIKRTQGILRVVTRTSYDIGDRVHFIKAGEIETMKAHNDGPPSGGWIVEKFDLFNTSVRQGITGECRTFANGSPLLEKSRVVNWKRSHMANVSFSLKLAGTTKTVKRDQIDFLHRQLSDWIEDRPHEWHRIVSLRFEEVDDDAEQKCTKLNGVLCHRESWHSYSAVRDSKSDILVFLRELWNNSRE